MAWLNSSDYAAAGGRVRRWRADETALDRAQFSAAFSRQASPALPRRVLFSTSLAMKCAEPCFAGNFDSENARAEAFSSGSSESSESQTAVS